MSWNDWVKNSLINCTDHGHSYMNVLTDGAIVGFDGTVRVKRVVRTYNYFL